MAEKAKEQPKDINLDMEHLTVKGKIHAEQYNNLRAQKMIKSERGSTSHSERFLKFNLSKSLYLLSSLN